MSSAGSPRIRCEINGDLVTLSPLHVGSGGTHPIATVRGKPGANEPPPEVAAIVRDARGEPWLPGTSIKGLLRRIGEAQNLPGDQLDKLFGAIKDESSGRAGQAIVYGAALVRPPTAIPEAPFVAGADTQLGTGVFVAARTRIDPGSGTAGDHTLFHQEMLAPGSRFRLRIVIETRARIDESHLSERERDSHEARAVCAARPRDAKPWADAALATLKPILAALAADSVWQIGKGQADGFGRIKLEAAACTIRALKANGDFGPLTTERLGDAPAPPAVRLAKTLSLSCDGPFLVVDASKTRQAGESEQGRQPHISAQAWRADLPMLLGSSLSGALRARAAWLAAREALRTSGVPAASYDKPKDAIFKAPPRPGPGAKPAAVARFERLFREQLTKLTPVQRLFGVTGFRGRLMIRDLAVDEARTWDLTSVKLDRFTAGPVDNALFTTRAFIGVKLRATLLLEARPAASLMPEQARKEDEDLFKMLMKDIDANGLVLGHGGNKGFGWFRGDGSP